MTAWQASALEMAGPDAARVAREAAEEDRKFAAGQIDREVAADTAAANAQWREHVAMAQHGMSAHEWERICQERADARAQRDLSAPYGSERNPAVLIDGNVMKPLPVARSRPSREDEQLARARNDPAHDRMVAYVARYDSARRQGEIRHLERLAEIERRGY